MIKQKVSWLSGVVVSRIGLLVAPAGAAAILVLGVLAARPHSVKWPGNVAPRDVIRLLEEINDKPLAVQWPDGVAPADVIEKLGEIEQTLLAIDNLLKEHHTEVRSERAE